MARSSIVGSVTKISCSNVIWYYAVILTSLLCSAAKAKTVDSFSIDSVTQISSVFARFLLSCISSGC